MSFSLLDIYTGGIKLFPMGNASLISNTLGFCFSWQFPSKATDYFTALHIFLT